MHAVITGCPFLPQPALVALFTDWPVSKRRMRYWPVSEWKMRGVALFVSCACQIPEDAVMLEGPA